MELKQQKAGFSKSSIKLTNSNKTLSSCLFNLHAEYIMQNAGLDEAQAESRFPGKISVNSYKQITPPLWQKVKKN